MTRATGLYISLVYRIGTALIGPEADGQAELSRHSLVSASLGF